MIKKTFVYQNWERVNTSRTAYFNISAVEIIRNLDLITEFEGIQKMLEGDARELTIPEKQRLVNFLERITKLAYGRRPADDPSRFQKTQDVWDEFEETGAYSGFIMHMFQNPSEYNAFMVEVMPPDLIEAGEKEMARQAAESESITKTVETIELPTSEPVLEPHVLTDDEMPAHEDAPSKGFKDFTRDELLAMTDEEFRKVVGTSNVQAMTHDELVVAMQRKTQQ